MTVEEFLNSESDIQPVRQMAYGPVVGEHHNAAMFGPNRNPLGATDVAASPDTGLGQGDLIMAADGTLHTVADWSYLHPNQPTHGTIEFRDRQDQGRGFVTKVNSIDDFLGTPKTAQGNGKASKIDEFLGISEVAPTIPPQDVQQKISELAKGQVTPTPQELSTLEAPEGSPQREDINRSVAGNVFTPPGRFAREPTLSELINASMPQGMQESQRQEQRIPLAPPLPEQGRFEQGGVLGVLDPALEAGESVARGLTPRTDSWGNLITDLAGFATPAVGSVQELINAPENARKDYANARAQMSGASLHELPFPERLDPVTAAQQMPEGPEKQQALLNAGANVVAQMLMAKGIAHGIARPEPSHLRTEPLVPEPPPSPPGGPTTIAGDVSRALERRFTLQEPPPEAPPEIAPSVPIEQQLPNIPEQLPFNPEAGPAPQPESPMPVRTEFGRLPGAPEPQLAPQPPLTLEQKNGEILERRQGILDRKAELTARAANGEQVDAQLAAVQADLLDPSNPVVHPPPKTQAVPPEAPVQAPSGVPGAGESPFAPYADEILKSANYVDKPEARLAQDAAGLYQPKLREINLPTKPEHNPYAVEFVRAHEQAHHIWSGLQNATAADLMRQDPAAFAAFKETSAGKSQIIRHKIKGEWLDNPTGFDWIEAIPDLYAEMKVKGIRHPELEAWLEKAIPEENRPPPLGAPEPYTPEAAAVRAAQQPQAPPVQTDLPESGFSTERAQKIYGDDAVLITKGKSAKAWKAIGQADKRNPYDVLEKARARKIATPDEAANLRAEHQRLLARARQQYGTPEYNDLAQNAVDFLNASKEVVHGPASEVMRGLQEADAPTYMSPADYDNILRERQMQATPDETATFTKVADEVRNGDRQAREAAANGQEALKKYRPRDVVPFDEAADYVKKQIKDLTEPCAL